MKHRTSAFVEDTCKLSLIDVLLLIIGREIKSGALVVGLWFMPKTSIEKRLLNSPGTER